SRGADTAPADTVLVSVKDIDAKAPPIFHQMCAALDGAKAMQLRVRATMDRPTQTGQLAQFHRTSSITVARPDRLHSKTESDEGKWVAWYRGTTLTVLDVDDNSYATQTVPGRIGDMLDFMNDEYDVAMPMADLLIG